MKRTGEAAPSPDGKWIVFALNEPAYDAAQAVSDLWIVPADGSAPARRLTFTKGGESGVAWSPDSSRIAFSAKREGDESDQLYVLHLAGGEAQRLPTGIAGAKNPKWRPDGKGLLFEAVVKGARKAPAKSSARVYDAMPVRYWNVWMDESRPHLYVWEFGWTSPIDLLSGGALAESVGFGGLPAGAGSERTLQAVWAPDGREIVFAAEVNRNEMMYAEVESHIFKVGVNGGEPVRLTAAGQSWSKPQFAPDGKSLYALHSRNATAQKVYWLTRLARFAWPAMSASAGTLLTDGWDRSVGDITISGDSKQIVFDAEDEGFSKLFRISAAGGKVELLLAPKQGGYTAPQFAGAQLIARYSASTQPSEIALVESAGHRLLTNFNAAKLAELDMPAPEHFWFTAKNGKKIHSVIQFPPKLDRSKKYPIVVFPHGGPNSMTGDSFSTRWNNHLLTSPGYVMIMTNYTGSTGFGEQFADDIERDVLRGPAIEILEAVTAAAAKYPFMDTTRQASIGASYGGYLMNWFNGHTKQFRALVNHAGAASNESQYGINDGGLGRELRMGGPVWEAKGQWRDQSPFLYAGNWTTPMLITQGELDYRVPLNESMTTFKILQRRKVASRVVFFPDEGHWILKGENNRHHMQEVLGWLEKYLK